MAPLELKGNSFDLAIAQANLPANASDTNYILVEFNAPLGHDEYEKMGKYQLTVEEYVGKDTYLCRYEPTDLNKLKELTFVKTFTIYPAKVKVSPELQQAVSTQTGNQRIQIHLHEGKEGDAQKVIEQIKTKTKPVTVHSSNVVLVSLTVDIKSVPSIAAIDGVRSIGIDLPEKPLNTLARGIMNCPPIVPSVERPNDPVLDGAGQIITVADTGFDKGNIRGDVHPAFQDRVRKIFSIGRKGPQNGVDPEGIELGLKNDTIGHGTHVSASAVGKGDSAETGLNTGTAPGAELIVHSLWDPVKKSLEFSTRSNLLEIAFREGSYVHSYSIGNEVQEEYDATTVDVDRKLYLNQKLLFCQAAGNEGDDTYVDNAGVTKKYVIAAVANQKNGITVGASYNNRRISGLSTTDKGGKMGNPHDIGSFSNPGRAGAARLKPDVVAPGVGILSAASRDPEFQAKAAGTKKWLGLVNVPGTDPIDEFGKAPNSLYCFSSGTSMATPQVAGCAAVLRQALIRRDGTAGYQPNASLVKALLIHGATDISDGTYQKKAIPKGPNNIQGNGLVNMQRSLLPVLDDRIDRNNWTGMWEDSIRQRGIPATRTSQTPNEAAGTFYDIDFTLVFTDAPGLNLQTRLDYYVSLQSRPIKIFNSPDREDNVLRLRVENVEAATNFSITVNAQRLFLAAAQPFSMVWTVTRK
ncbi:uncharacterized protein KY384_003452 [Bacidia gigantensis]|uniref:uncharacterized protein n=1 Tax=Bacidia gigantensis TaxID=2732470 RepID=UPI001D04EE47|nr:uncharacterized protein KY384_003452 [Bacidia gigantensis]KAG8531816.1 hypothetical protein KY384_003452 [Bacidia gigantensis]